MKRSIAALAAAVTVLVAGCTSATAGDGTSPPLSSPPATTQAPPTTSAPQTPPPTRTTRPAPRTTPKTAAPGDPVTVTVPTTVTGADKTAAAVAIATYRAFWTTIDAAYAAPGKDWKPELSKYEVDPGLAGDLRDLASYAQQGVQGTGRTLVTATVTGVYRNGAQVGLKGCVDTSQTKTLDKTGKNLSRPNFAGSWRSPQTVQLDNYPHLGWRITYMNVDVHAKC